MHRLPAKLIRLATLLIDPIGGERACDVAFAMLVGWRATAHQRDAVIFQIYGGSWLILVFGIGLRRYWGRRRAPVTS